VLSRVSEPVARRQVGGWSIGIATLAAVLFGPGTVELAQLSIRQHHLDRQLAKLQVEQERLTHEQERLRTDPSYVEGLIRTTFKQAHPGEYVIPLERDRRR